MNLSVQPLPAGRLLEVWERSLGLSSARRGLALLTAAFPDTEPEILAGMPIGARDIHLLELRRLLFGSSLVCLATCPTCSERLELVVDSSDLMVTGRHGDQTAKISYRNYHIEYRPPNSLDLMALERSGQTDQPADFLLERCLLVIAKGKNKLSSPFMPQLPRSLIKRLHTAIAEADPQADLHLKLRCPACGLQWQETFDILQYLWAEIHVWAQRTLYDVHVLARLYGWREADILALSPARRQAYIEMAT